MSARTLAWVAAVVTGLATLYIVGALFGMRDVVGAEYGRSVMHLGELAAVVALALCGAAGAGWLGRIGLTLAGIGQLLMAVAEPIGSAPAGTVLFGIAPNLTGLGLILAGIAVIRTGVWTGWQRWIPLVLGIYTFVPMTPMIIVSGGPPAPLALVGLLGWEILWVLLATAVLTASTADLRRPATSPA
ncbi:hypothetical protein [Pseudonocardia endophytica]|uniref:Uncharacterized protein n=1 Tax=Pseudonocardia endophytica TaxID=401976 RepID=A0A4R1I5H5_PSEEN|nr:hypothetical protein [Pseudonocardia endophytica]TCK27869.1 hypothetical protein EV378_3751 [Pseudonocardia endophytica]